jgi:dipeptidyl aminopeptidase/acylaminoacyl peptidase
VTRTVRNLKEAREEFGAAVRWYEEQHPGLGGEFFDAVVHATSLIQDQPEIGTLSRDRRTRRVLVQRFPYQVIYRLSADENEELFLASPQDKQPTDWSADGRFLLFEAVDPKTGSDIWALPFDGDRKPFPVVQTSFDESTSQFSPDGKWIAYQSNESGRYEIYLQPFPGPAGKSQVSTNGGAQVRWRRDGKELFYIAFDGRLMAVPIRFTANAVQVIDAGTPMPLFATHVGAPFRLSSNNTTSPPMVSDFS